ncbi:MAG: hypothetical protein HY882_13460 [Deltaproteobacteria bacterium]|nr:hypothetical protein [Deltaproteobacteria bacterium]
MKPRVYVDTSVIGGCFDEEFAIWSLKLFDEFRAGSKIGVISDLTRRELEDAPKNVKAVLLSLPEGSTEDVFLSDEAEQLALRYLKNGVVPRKQ